MRAIRTLVLRLMIEADEPSRLRGTVCAVDHEQELAFRDEQALLCLLHQFVRQSQVTDNSGGDAGPADRECLV